MRQKIDELLEVYLKVDEKTGWQKYPKGWDKGSVIKFAESLKKGGATEHGFFDACVNKISPHLDDPEGFCASVIDTVKGTTFWRSGNKKKD